MGGPPCQGFSHMGNNDSEDPRNQLFIIFFQIVKAAVPKFFLAENVPGILSPKNDKFIKQALSKVGDKYKILPPMKLVAKEIRSSYDAKKGLFLWVLRRPNKFN